MKPSLWMRHLSFTGLGRPPVVIRFEKGLNVIYGASDTGKSFVLEAVDYMLGGSKPLRDIPERAGYDSVALGVEVDGGSTFTLFRSLDGGSFRKFAGLHNRIPNDQAGTKLGAKHKPNRDNTLSAFLLQQIGLPETHIKTNAHGKTRPLSFRDLCHLCIVDEDEIHKKGSPVEGGQVINKTVEYSTFKFLITGVDDSALFSGAHAEERNKVLNAKVETLDELITAYQAQLREAGPPEDLADQIGRIDRGIAEEESQLQKSEEQYQSLVEQRNEARSRLENAKERRAEIDELLARFSLLQDHYQSDLYRLEGVREAGSLIEALPPGACPLCGAYPAHQQREAECDGNMDMLIAAVEVESSKIYLLRRELEQTVSQLKSEAAAFDAKTPELALKLDNLVGSVALLSPKIKQRRTGYTELVNHRARLQSAMALTNLVSDLNSKRASLEEARHAPESSDGGVSSPISSVALHEFAQTVEAFLTAWEVPNASGVHFDEVNRDVIISGKRRSSRGKGVRAITHSAFILALMKLCEDNSRPHPGFVILDSPLLSYRESDGPDDDLGNTDVQTRFYRQLESWKDRQVIVIENLDPPNEILKSQEVNVVTFGTSVQGPMGLFPPR